MATMWDDWIKGQRFVTAPVTPESVGRLGPMNIPAPMMMSAPPLSPLPAFTPAAPPMPQPVAAPAPMPSPRPAAAPMQIAPAPAAPSVREGFMQRLLGGPDYQSNNMPVVAQPQGPMGREMQGAPMPMQAKPMTAQDINWGNPENAADFFRADRALQNLPPEVLRGLLG
jgi:hypothetical protein